MTIPSVASFVYDGFGRRSSATRSGTTTTFLYDGWDVAQEQQGGTKTDLARLHQRRSSFGILPANRATGGNRR